MAVQPWTAEEDALLSSAYADGTILRPFDVACARLPHRTPNAISYRASTKGWAATRRERLGLPPVPGHPGRRARKPRDPAPSASGPAEEWREAAIVAEREREEARRDLVLARLRAENAEAALADFRRQNVQLVADLCAARAEINDPRGRVPERQIAPDPEPPPIPGGLRAGSCDRGEREVIRRRLVAAVIPTFARELGREPAAVADAILTVAKDGYRPHTFGAVDPFATPREAPKTAKR